MSNSQVIDYDFDYYQPQNIEEALEYLGREGAQVLAGGTDLLNTIKIAGQQPPSLVYIIGVKELDFIKFEKGLTIGATTLLSEIEKDDRIINQYPALAESIHSIGGTQIRNQATLAGNLCNASPGADSAPALITLKAQAEISWKSEEREIERKIIPLEKFFTGPGATILRPGELVTAILIPEAPPFAGSAFKKIARVKLDIAKINCSVYLTRDGDLCNQVRIVLGSVAPTPVRARRVEDFLEGKKLNLSLLTKATKRATEDISPITDVRSTEAYRRELVSVIIRDTLMKAWKRSGGEIEK